MTEEKKQEVQKTVVAFVAGLLIGGLLVWVFSAVPEQAGPSTAGDDEREEREMADGEEEADETERETTGTTTSTGPAAPTVVNGGSITVADQPAGVTVALGEISYPTANGWVVVHEDKGGALGNALGAARFSTSEGLSPTSVRLLRATVSGGTYHVVLYGENGDKEFHLDTDAPLVGSSGAAVQTSFVAL